MLVWWSLDWRSTGEESKNPWLETMGEVCEVNRGQAELWFGEGVS